MMATTTDGLVESSSKNLDTRSAPEETGGDATTTTDVNFSRPSDWEHAAILMKQNLLTDLSRKGRFFARLLLPCVMLVLWTIGFYFNYPEQSASETEMRGFVIHPAESWQFPERIALGGSDVVDLSNLKNQLKDWVPTVGLIDEIANSSAFEARLANDMGVFVDNASSFGIYYEETYGIPSSSRPKLAGLQHALNSALLNASGVPHFNVTSVQRTPEMIEEKQGSSVRSAPVVFVILPGIFLSLAVVIMMMFLISPMVKEKLEGVTQALLVAGVKRHVYMLQWASYYSITGLVTAAGLTVLSFVWKIYPMSNPGLVFLSHLLAMIQTSVVSALVGQLVNQEELANGLPWILGFSSMAVAVPFLVLGVAKWALAVFSVFSPFVGMIAYSAIYAKYDVWGLSVGVHPGLNVASSGLLTVTLAQIAGIGFWVCAILLFCSLPRWTTKRNVFPPTREGLPAVLDGDAFEPLSPESEVVVSIRNLSRSFSSGCIKKSKPDEVLKGLNMNICRGEVFGFLGHNGAGKSTTIRILSGEIGLDDGVVTYNFASGSVSLGKGVMPEIRAKIGVCPQHNTVIGDLTCRETLQLFARLKGVRAKPGQGRDSGIHDQVDRLLDELKFKEEDADKPVKSFSGGMQRRVCIAIALLGDPEVVFLDEPTAGCDPYTRRQIWDLIINAKRGRSIVLTTHFLDEADVLSDRIGIINKGKLMTCGSTLFLKNYYGVGYSLRYDNAATVDLNSMVSGAKDVSGGSEGDEDFCWELPYGTEPSFPEILSTLEAAGASNVSLDLTTLEEVFLETEERALTESGSVSESNESGEFSDEEPNTDSGINNSRDPEEILSKMDFLTRIWEPPYGDIRPVSFWKRLGLIQHFMMGNAWKTRGAVSLNVVMPLIYMVACLVVVRVIGTPETESNTKPGISISPQLFHERSRFFGVPEICREAIAPLVPTDEPTDIKALFASGALPVSGGYWAFNRTLQYNLTMSPFALQIGEAALADCSLWLHGVEGGIQSRLVPLQYEPTPFRLDILLVPLGLTFGFVGMVFSVLDVLILKSNNIFGLFRTVGISDWAVNLGICCYKCTTTFLPFFFLVVALGVGLESVAFGNAGRWLGTVLLLLCYAYAVTPCGLLLATFLSDYKAASNSFPGTYMTFVSLPYSAWSVCLQLFPQARHLIMVIGDVLCIIPPFAFQRGIGAVMECSSVFQDSDLSWKTVWSFENRIWFVLLLMLVVGSLEWAWLRSRTLCRPPMTKLSISEASAAVPVDLSANDVIEEHDRSLESSAGIRARNLVKIFRMPAKRRKGGGGLKTAVSGLSFGVGEGELYALVGPNGAGKSVTMSLFSGQHTPEHGEVCLDGECASRKDKRISALFAKASVAFVPQADALFERKTVEEHLVFYARVRGLDLAATETQHHIDAIIELLGLKEHLSKESKALSGGFKRRLSLATALVGYPRCLMLDEVTTGMSPDARHVVWEVLKAKPAMRQAMPAILLSTHYMDEASALGTRIGIVVDGALVATGTLSDLQEKYCHSFFVEMTLEHDAPNTAQEQVLAAFSSHDMTAEFYELYPHRFKMKVPFTGDDNRTAQLAKIFTLLETNKLTLKIRFYSVAHMNLEQIFIDLCRKQLEADEDCEKSVSNR